MDSATIKKDLGIRAKNIISNGLRLNVSKNGKASCVFHKDLNPSMSWFNDGLMWRCHSCNEQIDIYNTLAR